MVTHSLCWTSSSQPLAQRNQPYGPLAYKNSWHLSYTHHSRRHSIIHTALHKSSRLHCLREKIKNLPNNTMNNEKGIVLLDFWVSPFGQRCRIALAEKGIDYEYREEEGLINQKSALLLESNPIYKKIPVLIHDGKPICESLIIVQYIDEVWGGNAKLLPEDAYARSQARFWADFIDKKIYACGTKLWKLKGDAQAEAKKEFIGILKTLEKELGEKKFFNGDAFGYVDIALVPFTAWFYAYETCADFNTEKEVPKLMEWRKRCMEREGVTKSLHDPEKVLEFVCVLKKMLGIQ